VTILQKCATGILRGTCGWLSLPVFISEKGTIKFSFFAISCINHYISNKNVNAQAFPYFLICFTTCPQFVQHFQAFSCFFFIFMFVSYICELFQMLSSFSNFLILFMLFHTFQTV